MTDSYGVPGLFVKPRGPAPGRGKPVFPAEETRATLRLTGTRAFGNGVVELRYERAGG